jgi:hypothetical protein
VSKKPSTAIFVIKTKFELCDLAGMLQSTVEALAQCQQSILRLGVLFKK